MQLHVGKCDLNLCSSRGRRRKQGFCVLVVGRARARTRACVLQVGLCGVYVVLGLVLVRVLVCARARECVLVRVCAVCARARV